MKSIVYILLVYGFFISCKTHQVKETTKVEKQINQTENDTVRIVNEDVEYDVIIIEPGFNTWLITRAKPKGYYDQAFFESRNLQYVYAWNERVVQPLKYSPDLYATKIYYDPNVNYGYDVNYKLYNYFIYFQLTFKQQLTSYIPRN